MACLHAQADLAQIYRRAGRPKDALSGVRQVLRDTPTLHTAWPVLGDVLVDLQRYPEAVAAFSRARQADPQHRRLRVARAALAHDSAKTAEALFRGILRSDPSNVRALCGLAAVCVRSGFFAEGERLLRHALQQTAHEPLAGC